MEGQRLEGSYCPLCGEINLFLTTVGGTIWAYCGCGGTRPKESHTAWIVGEVPKIRPSVPTDEEE